MVHRCLVFWLWIYTTVNAQTTICIWGSTDQYTYSDYDRYNGEYIKQGTQFNSNSWWRQTPANANCATSSQAVIYAAAYGGEMFWQVSTSKTADWIFIEPNCETANLANPTSCPNDWHIFYNPSNWDSVGPLTWTITGSSCPTLACGRIQITGSGNSACNKIFTKDFSQDYVWTFVTASSDIRYLYFNIYTFKWYCSNTDGHMDCDDDSTITHQIWSSSSDGWKDANIGQSFSLSVTSGSTATFNCLDTLAPTNSPTSNPTPAPTMSPTSQPTQSTITPTKTPTPAPTMTTMSPTAAPTTSPTQHPSSAPTDDPTSAPTEIPTGSPSDAPTTSPTMAPTTSPTQHPSSSPTHNPTSAPTESPTRSPSLAPVLNPTLAPTETPTRSPSHAPSTAPTLAPTETPSRSPSHSPTNDPTSAPTETPTISPSHSPTNAPTLAPSYSPSVSPTNAPIYSPTLAPTNAPTISPTRAPSDSPTRAPTDAPSFSPTHAPTNNPSLAPSFSPTTAPTLNPTYSPSLTPTNNPTIAPSRAPSFVPTLYPTDSPTRTPSSAPTQPPTAAPSSAPTHNPSMAPTLDPTQPPSHAPSNNPSLAPSDAPSNPPSQSPTYPTRAPSIAPSDAPSYAPTDAPTITWSQCTPDVECAYIAQIIFTIEWSAIEGFGDYLSDIIWVQMKLEHLLRTQMEQYVSLENTLIVVSMMSTDSFGVEVMVGTDDREVIDALFVELDGSDDIANDLATELTTETDQHYKDSAFNVVAVSVESKIIKGYESSEEIEEKKTAQNTMLYIGIICGGLLVLIATLCGVWMCCKHRKSKVADTSGRTRAQTGSIFKDIWMPAQRVFTGAPVANMLGEMVGSQEVIRVEEEHNNDKKTKAAPPPKPFEMVYNEQELDL